MALPRCLTITLLLTIAAAQPVRQGNLRGETVREGRLSEATSAVQTPISEDAPGEDATSAESANPYLRWAKAGANPWLLGGRSTSLVGIFLACLFAWYYKYNGGKETIMAYVGPKNKDATPLTINNDRWTFGLFSCCDEPAFCCFTCCCGYVRWSDTISMAGFLGFTKAMALVIIMALVSSFWGAVGSCLVIGNYVYHRQQLRKVFDLPHGDFVTVCGDILTYMCCGVCAITQEARQVELAAAEGKLPKPQQEAM